MLFYHGSAVDLLGVFVGFPHGLNPGLKLRAQPGGRRVGCQRPSYRREHVKGMVNDEADGLVSGASEWGHYCPTRHGQQFVK